MGPPGGCPDPLTLSIGLTNTGYTNLGDSCSDILTITSATFLNCDLDIGTGATTEFFVESDDGSLNIGPGNFTVDGANGNTAMQGTLGVAGDTTLAADLAVNGCDITSTCATFNLLNAAPVTQVNFAGNATTVNIGADTGTTWVDNNLDVEDNLTVDGNTQLGNLCTDTLDICSTTDFKCDVEFYVDCSETTLMASVTAASGDIWTLGDLAVDGCDMTTACTTFRLLDVTPTTVEFAGNATLVDIGAGSGTTSINNDLDVDLDVNIDGCNLTSGCGTFYLLDATPTNVQFAGNATTVEIGDTSGTTTVHNDLDVDLDVNIDGCNLTSNCATFYLLDAGPTTVEFGGAATAVDIGAGSGTTSINNDLDVDLDVNVDGGDLTTNGATFNLIDTNASTVNFAGAATTVNIGADTGTTWVDNNLDVEDNLTVDGDTTLGDNCADTLSVCSLARFGCDIAVYDGCDYTPAVFTVASATGNTSISGNLTVSGTTNLNGVVNVAAPGLNVAGPSDLSGGNVNVGANNINITGDIGQNGARVNKGWFVDIEVTNMPTIGGTSIQTTFVDAAGDSMSGALDMTGNNINNVGTLAATTGNITTVNANAVSVDILDFDAATQAYTADAALTVTDSYMKITSDGAHNMTSISTGGVVVEGMVLVIHMTSANSVTLTEGTITDAVIDGNFAMAQDDTITLIFDGTNWIELSRTDT